MGGGSILGGGGFFSVSIIFVVSIGVLLTAGLK